MQMIDLDLFFWYLKGRFHGNWFCEKKWQTLHFRRSGIRNGMEYRYLNVRKTAQMMPVVRCSLFNFVIMCEPMW